MERSNRSIVAFYVHLLPHAEAGVCKQQQHQQQQQQQQ